MPSSYHPCSVSHCGAFFTDPHHTKQKSEGGSDNPANIAHLCRRHHDWAHANITRAHELGLIVFAWEPEHKKPILSVRIKPVKDKPKRFKSSKVTNLLTHILSK